MQLNRAKSIALGRRIHRRFGSWAKAFEAATKTENGVYRIDLEALAKPIRLSD